MTTATADAGNRVGALGPADGGRRSGLPGRLCAVVALGSVGAHLWMAWEHRAMPWEGALMLLMAAACLPCAASVWHRGHGRAVQLLFGMALAMVAVHAVLLLAPGFMAGRGHGGMGAMDGTSPMADGGMAAAMPQSASMLCIIALELTVAMLAAWVMRRSRACASD